MIGKIRCKIFGHKFINHPGVKSWWWCPVCDEIIRKDGKDLGSKYDDYQKWTLHDDIRIKNVM